MLPAVDAEPRGLLISERFLARHGDALDAAAREGGLALERHYRAGLMRYRLIVAVRLD